MNITEEMHTVHCSLGSLDFSFLLLSTYFRLLMVFKNPSTSPCLTGSFHTVLFYSHAIISDWCDYTHLLLLRPPERLLVLMYFISLLYDISLQAFEVIKSKGCCWSSSFGVQWLWAAWQRCCCTFIRFWTLTATEVTLFLLWKSKGQCKEKLRKRIVRVKPARNEFVFSKRMDQNDDKGKFEHGDQWNKLLYKEEMSN